MNVSFVGSGNVAWHLARALSESDLGVCGIVSRNAEHANVLAESVGAKAFETLQEAVDVSDVVVMCVSDGAIKTLFDGIQLRKESVIVHTSGATPMEVLPIGCHRGVLYPCMTFTKSDKIDMSEVPFLTEWSDDVAREAIERIVQRLSDVKPRETTSQDRQIVHAAAVMASNFTNHLLYGAQSVLAKADLPLDVLRPLVIRTIGKAFEMDPKAAQTGPARRHDTETMQKHLEIIDNKNFKEIYETISKSICETYTY